MEKVHQSRFKMPGIQINGMDASEKLYMICSKNPQVRGLSDQLLFLNQLKYVCLQRPPLCLPHSFLKVSVASPSSLGEHLGIKWDFFYPWLKHLVLYHRRGSQELNKSTFAVNIMLQEGKTCFGQSYVGRNSWDFICMILSSLFLTQ